MDWLKQYGETEGPVGVPMTDIVARDLEAVLAQNPGWEYERVITVKALEQTLGDRADVSWLTTEVLDRQKDIILTAGIDETTYKQNPVVTLNHDYGREPIGKSIWRQRVRENGVRGLKGKTEYPARPDGWEGKAWGPDAAWALVRSGLMQGKSIGFITLEASPPTDAEVKANPEWATARRVVRRCKLIEVAACWLPVNPQCLVEIVSKSLTTAVDLKALGFEMPPPSSPGRPEEGRRITFTPLVEIQKAVSRAIESIDVKAHVDAAAQLALAKAKGRV